MPVVKDVLRGVWADGYQHRVRGQRGDQLLDEKVGLEEAET